MNSPLTPDPLDRLLRRWVDDQSPAADDLDLLAGKIVQSIEDDSEPSGESDVVVQSRYELRFGPGAWLALSAAAVVVLACGFLWFGNSTTEHRPEIVQAPDLPPSFTWLRDDQLRNKSILLHEMEAVFGRKLKWLAETGDNVQVDVEGESSAGESSTDDGPALAVRVVVQRRQVGQQDWTVTWAIDVVARSEEVVRLGTTAKGEPQFEMWAYALPDGMIALDTDVNLSDAGRVRSTTSGLQSDCEPRKVFTTLADGFEFRVFQTASVLNDRLS